MNEIDFDFLKKVFPNFKAWLETAEGDSFTEADIGGTVVSVRAKRSPFPKEYYHLKCWTKKPS